jgi:FkbM family methyltransferase
MWITPCIRRLVRAAGFDWVRFVPAAHPVARRMKILADERIDLVLDIGANVGQFGREMRAAGYRGRIESFEPIPDVFAKLRATASGDPAWKVHNLALGPRAADVTLNVSANTFSSSVLGMLATHERAAPESAYVRKVQVRQARLDDMWAELRAGAARPMLKLDVQGYEHEVFAGAETALKESRVVQVEMSLVPLYEGSPIHTRTCDFLRERGYRLVSVEPGFADPVTGHLLQMDGIFLRGG